MSEPLEQAYAIPSSLSGEDISEDVRVLVREIRSNKILIRKTTQQVREARKSVRSRKAWRDFVKKYF